MSKATKMLQQSISENASEQSESNQNHFARENGKKVRAIPTK